MRRLWVLVLLAAVATMHGVPAPVIDPGSGRGAVVSVQHGTDHGIGPSVVVDGIAGEPSDRGAPGHDTAAHALSLCVAVLLGGLALLAAASVTRAPAPPADHGWTPQQLLRRAPLPRPRPPDLATLCLLRI